jgi:single-stranded DNA-binding protein
MNINRILFAGNLTADPEVVDAGKTKVVNASLAANEFYYDQEEERQQVTTFLDVKIWGASAENAADPQKPLKHRGKQFIDITDLRNYG